MSLCSLCDSEGQGNKRRNPYQIDVGPLGVVRPGRIALTPYATTRCAGETTGPAHRGPHCNCPRPRPLPAASDDDRHLDFTDEQVELLVDRFSATLQKPSDFVDMPTRSRLPNGSSSCIRVAGPPTSWAAVPKPSGKQASLESPYGLRIPCALHE